MLEMVGKLGGYHRRRVNYSVLLYLHHLRRISSVDELEGSQDLRLRLLHG